MRLAKRRNPQMKPRRTIVVMAGLLLLVLVPGSTATAPPPLPLIPNPVLYLTHLDFTMQGGKQYTRYNYDVFNKDQYPADMFAAAPNLPPCGKNTKAARTWVDLYDQSGKRLNGFCALGKSADLNGIWFSLDTGVVPPSWIYIELNDRKTNTKYKSNLSDTTL